LILKNNNIIVIYRMPKTRAQKVSEKKSEVKVNEFKNDNYRPVASGDLKHSSRGRRFFYAKFEGEGYTHDSIQRFTQQIANEYKENGEAREIQISVNYDKEGYRSSKLSDIGSHIDLTDFSERYAETMGGIIGFIIYLA